MMRFLPLLCVILAGVGVAIQTPTNAMLARVSGSAILAALVSFTVGFVVLACAWGVADRTSPLALRGAPAWAWAGGVYGAAFVAALAFAAPRLGLATTLTLAILSQLATALLLDHFGLLGLKVAPFSLTKLAGVALMLAGVVLVRRG